MRYKVEYSQTVRQKIKNLKSYLTDFFGDEIAKKGIKTVTDNIKKLEQYPEIGMNLSDMFDVDTDFKYIYINHNYIFYYIEDYKVIVSEMFDEREDFMYKLFHTNYNFEEQSEFWDE